MTITDVAFSSENGFPGGTRTDNITVSLSTTTASLASPSSNYAANKGTDFTTVFTGPLTFTSLNNNTFDVVIPIAPFTYNPSGGNLLVDVV